MSNLCRLYPLFSKEGVTLWNICFILQGGGEAIIYTFVYYFEPFVKKILMKHEQPVSPFPVRFLDFVPNDF